MFSHYDSKRASGLLRQLLFDDKSIISEAKKAIINSQSVASIKFFCQPHEAPAHPSLVFSGSYDGFYPHPGMHRSTATEVSLDSFGRQVVIVYSGREITVKDVVKYMANKEGGVHFDKKDIRPEEELLKELNDSMLVGGTPALFLTLRSIGLVVLDGLRELENEARKALNI